MNDNDPFKDLDKVIDKTVKWAKALIITTVIGALIMAGLVTYVVLHFITKWW
jgi:hypothetical protein